MMSWAHILCRLIHWLIGGHCRAESGRQGILVSQMQSDMRLWGKRQALADVFLKDACTLMLTTLDALQRHAAKQAASAQQADTQTQV